MADYEILIDEEGEPHQTILFKFINEDSHELSYYMSIDELELMYLEIKDLLQTLGIIKS